jgi:hypothetical protein
VLSVPARFRSGRSQLKRCSAGPAQVERAEFAGGSFCGELLDYVPNKLFGDFFAQGLPALLARRKTFPVSMCAAFIHSFNWS